MLTLSDVMRAAWTNIGDMVLITATGGSATTIVDANTRYTTDNALMGGTAIVVTTTDGLAPQGKYSRISSFVASTKTFTIATVTETIGSGDVIGLAKSRINAVQMAQAVNDALAYHVGTISLVDTSLTTVTDQSEYAVPIDLKIKKLLDVLIQTRTNDADRNDYKSIKGQTQYFPAAAGSTGLLVIPNFSSGYKIKLVYEGLHPDLTAYNSVVSETIPEQLIVAATVDKATEWLMSKKGDAAMNGFLAQRRNEAIQVIAGAKAESPVNRTARKPKWFSLHG